MGSPEPRKTQISLSCICRAEQDWPLWRERRDLPLRAPEKR